MDERPYRDLPDSELVERIRSMRQRHPVIFPLMTAHRYGTPFVGLAGGLWAHRWWASPGRTLGRQWTHPLWRYGTAAGH